MPNPSPQLSRAQKNDCVSVLRGLLSCPTSPAGSEALRELQVKAPRTVLLAEARSILRDEHGLDEDAVSARMNELADRLYRR